MSKSGLHHPHDNLFQAAMAHKSVAYDFLNSRLPLRLKKRVDLNTLRLEPDTFVDNKLTSKRSDIIYAAQIDKKEGYIYTLVEQQSQEARDQVIRLLEYNARLLRLHKKQHPQEKKLPPIINIVLYTGDKAYQGPRSIADAFYDADLFLESLREPFLIDAAHESDEKLIQDKTAALLEIMLKHGKVRDLCKLLDDQLVASMIYSSVYKKEVIFYVAHHDKHGPDYVLKKLPKLALEEQQEVMTYVQKSIQKEIQQSKAIWQSEGVQQGIQQGIQQGRSAERKSMLDKLISQGVITSEKAEALMSENASS